MGTVHSGPRCASKHPAERGSEGWRCNSQKLHPSLRQRHFSLHRMSQSGSVFAQLFPFLLEFCSWLGECVLRLRESYFVNNRWRQPKAQRVKTEELSQLFPVRESLLAPDVRILCSFPAADVKEAAGAKWTPQRVPVSRHQPISAMVCRLRVYVSASRSVPSVWQHVQSGVPLLLSEMASVDAALSLRHHPGAAELPHEAAATAGGEEEHRHTLSCPSASPAS